MIKCRHGLMLVGPANSGKTTTYRVLSDALTLVSSEAPSFEEKEVETYVINPKSIARLTQTSKNLIFFCKDT